MKDFSLKNHLTVIVVLAGLALVLDFLIPGLNFFNFKNERPSAAFLVVDYGRNATRRFSGEVIEQMTVLDVLAASSRGGLKVEFGKDGESAVLLSVDGQSGGQLKIKLNGYLIPVEKVNQTAISRGDLIKVELP